MTTSVLILHKRDSAGGTEGTGHGASLPCGRQGFTGQAERTAGSLEERGASWSPRPAQSQWDTPHTTRRWAHLEFTRTNVELTIPKNQIEDHLEFWNSGVLCSNSWVYGSSEPLRPSPGVARTLRTSHRAPELAGGAGGRTGPGTGKGSTMRLAPVSKHCGVLQDRSGPQFLSPL